MNTLAALLLLGILAAAQSHNLKETLEQAKKHMDACKAEENVSDDVIKKYMAHEATDEVKCFGACVATKFGLMTGDNMLNMDAAIQMGKSVFGEKAELMDKAESILGKCTTVTDANRCEAASKIFFCIKEAHIDAGVPFPF